MNIQQHIVAVVRARQHARKIQPAQPLLEFLRALGVFSVQLRIVFPLRLLGGHFQVFDGFADLVPGFQVAPRGAQFRLQCRGLAVVVPVIRRLAFVFQPLYQRFFGLNVKNTSGSLLPAGAGP
jgi:hypothetical protein